MKNKKFKWWQILGLVLGGAVFNLTIFVAFWSAVGSGDVSEQPSEAITVEFAQETTADRFIAETTAQTEAATKAEATTAKPTQAATKAPTQAQTKAPTQAVTQAPTKAPTQVQTQIQTQAHKTKIIGNINSHKYHTHDCGSLPIEKNRVYFDSIEKAKAAGYSLCGNCNK